MPKMQYYNGSETITLDAKNADAIKQGSNIVTPSDIGVRTDLQTTTTVSIVEAINSLIIKDTLNNKFKWGVENGMIFLQEV